MKCYPSATPQSIASLGQQPEIPQEILCILTIQSELLTGRKYRDSKIRIEPVVCDHNNCLSLFP